MTSGNQRAFMVTKIPIASPTKMSVPTTPHESTATSSTPDSPSKDGPTSSPKRRSGRRRKPSGPLMKAVDLALPGVALQTRKLLYMYAKENGQVDLNRFPREHHHRLQVHLLSIDFSRGIKSHDLTFVVVREGIENLWYLIDYSKRDDSRAAGLLARQTHRLILAIEQIASLLEDYSNVKPTNWLQVAELLQKEALFLSQYSVPYPPAKMKYFRLDKLLGAGGFGAVYKSFLGKVQCTLKFVPCERMLEPKFACMDKLVASMVNHPSVVKYYACFATKEAFVTCMEYIKGCDLNKVLNVSGFFPEKITRIIIAQLGEALSHMHAKGFIHRDIKPANLIVMNGCRIKLIDFDTAKACIGKFVPKPHITYDWRTAFEFTDNEVAGTMPYFPPECCPMNPQANNLYGRSMDWWAVGVTTFQLSTGQLPFANFRSEPELKALINSGQYMWPNNRAFSSTLVQFVADLLNVKAHERLCSRSYSDFRNHSFFAGLDWQLLRSMEFLKDFPPINRCMTRTNAGFSPMGSPEAEQRKQALFPHQIMVALVSDYYAAEHIFCGGALISEEFAVTAAHCVAWKNESRIAVRLGEHNLQGETEIYPHQDLAILRKIVHEKFNWSKENHIVNDVALLQLAELVTFRKHIVPICLPMEGANFAGEMATVSGWGRMWSDFPISPARLREISVPVVSNDVCQAWYAEGGRSLDILKIWLCAGLKMGGKDSCTGDSGGPLVVERDGRAELVGLVSFGFSCGLPYAPGIYTNVSNYVHWIEANMNAAIELRILHSKYKSSPSTAKLN